ncbi:MAG TPA: putative peptidoglycan-binding domain-containing protein [Acidisoma sp.]|nr:putative peptidoglycan-binding domain-containing protein [Acidisoma sp.]
MQANYASTTAFTREQEGGYTNDAHDSGNWSSGIAGQGALIGSNMGCGAPATIAYMAKVQPGFVVTADWMQALPPPVYDGMATSAYWNPLQCPDPRVLPGLDLALFDFGWNTGIGSSAKRLQWLIGAGQDGDIGNETLGIVQSCGLAPIARALSPADARTLQTQLGVTADGDVGDETLQALAAQPSARPVVLLLGLGEAQAAYYRSLSNFSTYGDGWLARTSARLAAGLSLAAGVAPAAKALRMVGRAPSAIEPADAPAWRPFEPGRPIAAQAARPAA